MNYGQLKSEIRDLGFSEDAEIAEFADIVPNSINRAITEINLTVCPITGVYQIEQDGTDNELLYYDMEELTKENDVVKFLEFADTPVMYGTDVYKKFADYEIEQDRILIIDGSTSGKFKVFYKKAHEPFTTASDDSIELPLPLKAHHLVPLLASYYIWLEDEKAKAVDYYNQYEKLSQKLIEGQADKRVRILSGGM